VLFIGTQFSNLYTAVDTPARGRVVVCLGLCVSMYSDILGSLSDSFGRALTLLAFVLFCIVAVDLAVLQNDFDLFGRLVSTPVCGRGGGGV
jgi:predicted MFS family arabinose efflux permease